MIAKGVKVIVGAIFQGLSLLSWVGHLNAEHLYAINNKYFSSEFGLCVSQEKRSLVLLVAAWIAVNLNIILTHQLNLLESVSLGRLTHLWWSLKGKVFYSPPVPVPVPQIVAARTTL